MSDDFPRPPQPKKVVIFEDEIISALHLKRHLQQTGYEVSIPSLKKALELTEILSSNPDILFVDVNLGIEMDGIELAKRISTNLSVPIVLITGYRAAEVKDRAVSLPILGILEKPIRTQQLEEILKRVELF